MGNEIVYDLILEATFGPKGTMKSYNGGPVEASLF